MTFQRISIAGVLFLSVASLPADDENFRVVVQSVQPELVGVSQDARIVVARGYDSKHTLQVIDIAEPAVLMVVDLPEQVAHAAVAPRNDWFVVSCEESIFRVDRVTGNYEVLLPNITGAVALNETGDRLAVLGTLQIDHDRRIRFPDAANLGVYDLTQMKWLAKTRTPIMIDQLVYFDGDDVVGYGRGGRVHNRASSSFRCDVRLNVDTGESKLNRGRELDWGSRDDDQYAQPKQVAALLEGREAVDKRINEVRDKLILAQTAAASIIRPLPVDDPVLLLIGCRHANGSAGGLLSIPRDGRIDITSVKIDNPQYVRLLDNRLVQTYDADRSGTIFDLQTKQPVLQIPPLHHGSSSGYYHRFFPTGCLLYKDSTLSWYQTTKPDPVWQTKLEQPLRNLHRMFVSPDGRYLASGHIEGDIAIDVYSLATGKAVVSIPRTGQTLSGTPSFSHDGNRLGATIGKRFHLYEMPSGKRLRDEPVPHAKHHWYVTSVGEHWVIGSGGSSNVFHAKTLWGPKIPLEGVYRAAKIRCLDRASWLVETRRGIGAIVDIETGDLKSKWYVGKYQGASGGARDPPRAFTSLNGKLLIRNVDHAAEIELIDLETLTPIAKVHPVPVDQQLGWVISTSDGYWDASPGAEMYVTVYDGLRRLTPDAIAARRDSAGIRRRISRLGNR